MTRGSFGQRCTPPKALTQHAMTLTIELDSEFQLFTSLPTAGVWAFCLGLESSLAESTDRLAHSGGGSFLLTGMRGTGKTTVLHRAIADWRHESSDEVIVAVHLVLARPMDEETLLFEIIRRLFEELTTEGLLSDLEEDLRESLLVAYARTSYSQKQSHSATREHQAGMSVGGPMGRAGVSLPFPKGTFGRKIADTTATDAAPAHSLIGRRARFPTILRRLSEPRPRATGRLERCRELGSRKGSANATPSGDHRPGRGRQAHKR